MTDIEQLAREALDVVASTNIQFDNDRLDRARYVPGLAKAVLELSEKLRSSEAEIAVFKEAVGKLFVNIKHGDDEHQSWLKKQLDYHFEECFDGSGGIDLLNDIDHWRARAEAAEHKCKEDQKARAAIAQAIIDFDTSVKHWRARAKTAEEVCESATAYRACFQFGANDGEFPATIRNSQSVVARNALENRWQGWRKSREQS